MTMKIVLSCIGVAIGGAGAYWQAHDAEAVLNVRFWVGLAFAGLIPVGTYFVGLAQRAPWVDAPVDPTKPTV